MQSKIKDKIIVIGFCVILAIVFIANILIKDQQISITERRKLEQFPEITVGKVLSGDTSEEFEEYAIDQCVGRDFFRSLKSFFNKRILSFGNPYIISIFTFLKSFFFNNRKHFKIIFLSWFLFNIFNFLLLNDWIPRLILLT